MRYDVNRETVERAYRMANEAQKRGSPRDWAWCDQGFRAALARDTELLRALDQAAEVMVAMNEEQYGRMQRDTSLTESERVTPTEVQLWREAYKLADEGRPTKHFAWIYAAAGWLAGSLSVSPG